MDKLNVEFEKLKISAFSKYCKLTGDINNVTIGPNSTFIHDQSRKEEPKPPTSKKTSEKTSPQKQITPKKSPLPINHVLRELEVQRREKVQEAVDDHYKRFEQFSKIQKEEKETQWFLQQQNFIQNMQESEQVILQALNQQDVNKSKQNEKLIKHYQDLIQRKMMYEQQLEKNKEKQRILNENIERIKKNQSEFRVVYQDIISIIKTCASNEELRKTLGENFKLLKILPESLDEIISRCRTFTVDEEQLIKSATILNQVKTLKSQIEEAVVKINMKKKEEEEKLKVPVQQPQPPVKETTVIKNSSKIKSTGMSLDQFVSPSNFKRYSEIKQFLLQHSGSLKDFLADEQLKQFRFDCKKAVNIPVNAICGFTAENLRDKYIKLNSLLSGKTVSIPDKQINASRHPQGIPYCMDLLARKFVVQGDLSISSKPEAAFHCATIIVSLWNDFPDFGKLLLGYFYTRCPYLVPFYIPRTNEQTDEDYYVSLGYQYVDGQIEKQDKFLKRMTGILRLYFAIFIAKPKSGQTKNPHDIKNAWNFLVSILKLDPELDITATVLFVFLENVGFEMERVYGMAFKKLVRVISEKYIPILKGIDSGGPVSRLEGLLQDYKTTGQFNKPNGILTNNFW